MTATYRNPWHLGGNGSGPAAYETDAQPTAYRGYLIYERVRGVCWDVVLNGEAVSQRAGLHGARRAIDELCSVAAQP